MNVAVIGSIGAGKTTLAYSLSHYLRKRGRPAFVYNFDPFAKHLTYPVDFDVRKKIKKSDKESLAQIYEELLRPEKTRDTMLFDLAGGIDFFLPRKELLKKFDLLLYVCEERDEKVLDALQDLLLEAFKTPVVIVVNKMDLKRREKSRLFSESKPRAKPVAFVSAWEKTGLSSIAEQLA